MSPKTLVKCAALALLIGATGLAGCGRRGDLEPAPEAGVSARQARQESRQATPANPIGTPAAPRAGGIVKPKDPFILDPLL